MSDFWDYRGWERHEENHDWQDIQGDNLEYRADALMNRAIHNGLEDDAIEKTIIYIASANDINREIERIPELLRGLLMLGDCYLKLKKADEVMHVAVEAQKLALETFNDHARAYAVHMQGFNAFENKQYGKAAELAMNAGEIYEEGAYFEDACEVYMSAGRLFRWHGERAKSIEGFENALRAARTENNLENIVEAKLWLAYMQTRVKRIVSIEESTALLEQTYSQMQIAKQKGSVTRRYELASAWNTIDSDPFASIKYFDSWLQQARENKVHNDSAEAMLGRAYALRNMGLFDEFAKAMHSILAVLEEIESTVAVLEVVEPLTDYYIENSQFQEAELIWVRAKAIADKNFATEKSLIYFDQMIALCIAEYAEPVRALTALESTLPKTIESPLPFDYEYALAKAYAANDRRTESLIVIDRALDAMSDIESSKLEYAELHELKCELLAKEGNLPAAKNEARLSFEAYFDLNRMDKAKRLKTAYLQPQPGDAHPETGAITIANWE